jgi:hypothetical protein
MRPRRDFRWWMRDLADVHSPSELLAWLIWFILFLIDKSFRFVGSIIHCIANPISTSSRLHQKWLERRERISFACKKYRKKHQRNRRRSITDLEAGKRLSASPVQQNGAFLARLPLELRLEIYSYVFLNLEIIAVPFSKMTAEGRIKDKREPYVKPTGLRLLSLPMTCRQM